MLFVEHSGHFFYVELANEARNEIQTNTKLVVDDKEKAEELVFNDFCLCNDDDADDDEAYT